MSQHDFTTDNGSGQTVRTDIQAALQALASQNSGTSAPVNPYPCQRYRNTSDGKLYERNAANTAWVVVEESAGAVLTVHGRAGAVVAASGDYTAAQITNTPAGGIAATTVQAALNELDGEKLSSANDAVGNANLRNSAACSVIGCAANSTGDPADIAAASSGHYLRRAADSLAFGAIAAADLPAMVGDSGSGGVRGAVPAPAAGDAAAGKYLKADGSWAVPAGGGTFLQTLVHFSVWSNQPSGDWVQWADSFRKHVDLTGMNDCRLYARIVTAGAANAEIGVKYSPDDGANWYWLDGDSGPTVAINAAANVASAKRALSASAKALVLVSVFGRNGDGAADPNLVVQLQYFAS